MENTATNQNNFVEKKFAIAATKAFVEKYGETAFAREHALPNLYRQASVHFGNENWYTIGFDTYLEGNFYCFTITCQQKPTERN